MSTVRYTTIEGEVIAEKRAGTRSLYVPDALGSTVALLNSSQMQTDTLSYYPYGTSASRTGATPTPYQFVGTAGYYADATGKTYAQARYLDSGKGRWLTADPIGFDGGDFNLYRYVKNNPTRWKDPSGTQVLIERKAISSTIVIIIVTVVVAGIIISRIVQRIRRGRQRKKQPKKPDYGQCTPAQWQQLTDAVDYHCKRPGRDAKCRPGDNCETILKKIATREACIAARLAKSTACYPSSDPGHDKQIDQEKEGIQKCVELGTPQGCFSSVALC